MYKQIYVYIKTKTGTSAPAVRRYETVKCAPRCVTVHPKTKEHERGREVLHLLQLFYLLLAVSSIYYVGYVVLGLIVPGCSSFHGRLHLATDLRTSAFFISFYLKLSAHDTSSLCALAGDTHDAAKYIMDRRGGRSPNGGGVSRAAAGGVISLQSGNSWLQTPPPYLSFFFILFILTFVCPF